MLQFERNSRPPNRQMKKNFLALNKSAVAARSKEVSKRLAKEDSSKKRSNRVNVHDEVQRKNQEKQPSYSQQSHSQQSDSSKSKDDTVTISKKYLEELLRSTYMREHLDKHDLSSMPHSVSATGHNVQPASPIPTSKQSPPVHVEMDHGCIPGLEDFSVNLNKAQAQKMPKARSQTKQSSKEEEDPPPLLPSLSPRAGETYHRGTYSRPIHPAMKSNIVFGNEALPPPTGLTLQRKIQEDPADQLISQKRFANSQVAPARHAPPSVRQVNPYDVYKARESEMKRQKELEYKECLRIQIEDKQRRKEEERLRKEREEREDEERVAREQEQLRILYEREREMQLKKEEQKARKIKAFQQRLKEAEESAYVEKERLRLKRSPQRELTFDGGGCGVQSQSMVISEDIRASGYEDRLTLPSSTDINRSPSMHQILPPPSDTRSPSHAPHHHKSPSHTHHTRQHKPPEQFAKSSKTRLKKQIPGSQISLGSTSPEEPSVAPRKARTKPSGTKGGLADPSRSKDRKGSGPKETITQRKLAIRKQLERNIHGAGINTDSESEVPHLSNPVPNSVARSKAQANTALNRVRQHHYNQRPSSTDSQTSHQHHGKTRKKDNTVIKVRSPSLSVPAPSSSPPVPAVAKRLALEHSNPQTNDIHDKLEQQSPAPIHNRRSDTNIPEGKSPPFEAAPILRDYHHDNDDNEPIKLPHIVIGNMIHRAPSCSPDYQPSHNVCKLPPIQELGSREDRRAHDGSRQQQILEQLSQLRQGIVSHTSGVDARVSALLKFNTKLKFN